MYISDFLFCGSLSVLRIFSKTLLSAGAALLFLVTCSTLAASENQGSALVRVVDGSTQRPVFEATILIKPRDSEALKALSDVKGLAEIENLEAGLYEVFISHPGYLSSRLASVRKIEGKANPLRIELVVSASDVEEMVVIGSTKSADKLGSAGSSYIDREELSTAAGSGSDVLRALDDDWIRYVYDKNDFRPDPNQRYIVLTPQTVNNQYENSSLSYDTYFDQTVEFDRWDVRGGLRYEHDALSEQNLVSPRVGANWNLSKVFRISTTAGIYYQSPSFEDRAIDISNLQLENEKIQQFSVGFKYYPAENYEILVEPYYQILDNLVIDADKVNQTLTNGGEGTSAGIDAAIIRRFGNGWSANLNYSFNRARLNDGPNQPTYDADNPGNSEFNQRSGEDAIEDGSAVPLFGFLVEL